MRLQTLLGEMDGWVGLIIWGMARCFGGGGYRMWKNARSICSPFEHSSFGHSFGDSHFLNSDFHEKATHPLGRVLSAGLLDGCGRVGKLLRSLPGADLRRRTGKLSIHVVVLTDDPIVDNDNI